MELIFESRASTPRPFLPALELSLFGTYTPLCQVAPQLLKPLGDRELAAIQHGPFHFGQAQEIEPEREGEGRVCFPMGDRGWGDHGFLGTIVTQPAFKLEGGGSEERGRVNGSSLSRTF